MASASPDVVSPSAASAGIDFDTTLGALLVGGLLGMALWGITSVQAYHYFLHIKNKDGRALKLTVAFLWALDTVDSCLSTHTLYYYLITNFGNLFSLLKPSWSIIYRVVLTSSTNYIIRSLFAHRVYRLSKGNIYFTGWIMVMSTVQFSVGIAFAVETSDKDFSQISQLKSLFYALFCFSTASDLSVTAILFRLLYKSRTGYAKTDSIIRVLIAYTVNTGIIVALNATIAMITFITMPDNFIFIAFYLVVSKLYLNSYLGTLNARETLRNRAEMSFQMSGGHSSGRRDHEENSPDAVDGYGSKYLAQGPSHSFSPTKPVEVSIFQYTGQVKD